MGFADRFVGDDFAAGAAGGELAAAALLEVAGDGGCGDEGEESGGGEEGGCCEVHFGLGGSGLWLVVLMRWVDGELAREWKYLQ